MLVLTPFQTTTTYYQGNMVEYFLGFCPCSLTKCIANGAPDFAWDREVFQDMPLGWDPLCLKMEQDKGFGGGESSPSRGNRMCEALKGWK